MNPLKVACILISPPNVDSDLHKISKFAEACLRFSPQIAIHKSSALFIEIGKCRSLYSETSFTHRTQVLLKRFNIQAKIAIARDVPSSLALARYQVASTQQLPIECLEDFSDPWGKYPQNRKTIVKMIESLRRLGILTLAEFQSLPPSQIPSRFGSLGVYCRQLIDKASHLPWPIWTPPEKLEDTIELLPSEYCSDLEPLLFLAKELCDRLFSRLRGRFLRAEKIRFSLRLENYSTVTTPLREWNFEFISPQGSTQGFLPILKERLSWDLQRNPIESWVTQMHCEISSTTSGRDTQKHLFRSQDDFTEALGSLFGQLEEYLGKDKVFWAKLTEERFPEKSWRRTRQLKEAQERLPNLNSPNSPQSLDPLYPHRPTRIFQTPIPITVIEDRIVFKRRIFKSIHWSPVERLSPDWIDDVPARNYYRVDLEGGKAIWVFSEGSHYFAHGYFE